MTEKRLFPYKKAVALMDLYPDALFVAEVNGMLVSLHGPKMRGFLLPSDEITEFKRFA